MTTYLPLMLKMDKKQCLVVGGGVIAERKIRSLLEANAQVTIVAPAFTEQIVAWVEAGVVRGHLRKYETSDASEIFLLIAASDHAEVNDQAAKDAKAAGALVMASAADEPEHGDVIMPSVVRRGRLVIGISTSGASPALAAVIRRRIEKDYSEDYEAYLDFLHDLRVWARNEVEEPQIRRELMAEVAGWDMDSMPHSHSLEELLEALKTALRKEASIESAGQVWKEFQANRFFKK